MPLMAVPDRYVTFRLLKATKPHADALTAGGAQLYTAIDMKFTLFVMHSKRYRGGILKKVRTRGFF